ncbi:MAG: endonuclease/exonuclease/phosphatase family protein [Pseudomonadota bacterium]
MRLLLFNIRYGVGSGAAMHVPVPGAGYLLGNPQQLDRLIDFIKLQAPDVCGLIEVDTGSIRSRMINQAESIAAALEFKSSYETKYGGTSVNNLLPIVRKQGNALLAGPNVHHERFHFFDTGIKKLVIELELDDCAIFLVHLSLKYRHRHLQLRHLYDLIRKTRKPVIVAGDFNTFWGGDEIYLFQQAAGLHSANVERLPSYPSNAPRRELDYILHQDPIRVTRFDVPQVQLSDHLPLVCDFEIG